ncbi:MAG: hypothetical protein WBD36_13775, partial [Bacteroidota bacterium]
MNKLLVDTILFGSLQIAICVPASSQGLENKVPAQAARTLLPNADQIHFSIISGTAVTFDWIGATDTISYGTNPGNLESLATATPSLFLPVTSPWVSDPGPYW